MNSLVNQAKSPNPEEDKGVGGDDVMKDVANKKVSHGSKNTNSGGKEIKGHIGFVKVNMDGLAIGRKVDLNSHASYDTLAQALEEMFFKPNITVGPIRKLSSLVLFLDKTPIIVALVFANVHNIVFGFSVSNFLLVDPFNCVFFPFNFKTI